MKTEDIVKCSSVLLEVIIEHQHIKHVEFEGGEVLGGGCSGVGGARGGARARGGGHCYETVEDQGWFLDGVV